MKRLAPVLLILGLAVGWAWAQNISKSIAVSQDPTGGIGVDSANNIYFPAHVLTVGYSPIVTSCGTTGFSVAGTDWAGLITVGSSAATACTLTFSKAYLAAPTCLLTWTSGPLAAMSWTTSTTAITIAQTSTANDTIAYLCTGAK